MLLRYFWPLFERLLIIVDTCAVRAVIFDLFVVAQFERNSDLILLVPTENLGFFVPLIL
jgi:hypothetical protein